MQHPTYAACRELALSQGRSIEYMARHPQASAPLPTACLALVELHDWSLDRISDTWGLPVEHVTEALSTLSTQPLHRVRQVPPLPPTKDKTKEHRDLIRLLYRQGASVEELVSRFFYYSPEVMGEIVKQPLETDKSRAFGNRSFCHCGCGVKVEPRQMWATPGCKKRTQRKSVTTSK